MNPPTTLAPEEVQRIQADTIRRVIQLLTERAHDPAKIGRRVLVWKCSLRLPETDGRMLRNADLARRLNVSEARASAAVSTAQSQIFDLKTLRGGEPVATSSDPVGQMNETVPKPNDGAAIPLPTALDIAQAKQKYDSTPLTTEFFRVLRSGSRHFPPEMLREGKAVKVSAQTLEVIGFAIGTSPRFSGEPLFTDEEISTLKDLQSRMEATVKLAEEFSLAKVNDHIHKKRDAVHAAIDSGEQVGDMSIPTREQVTAEFRMKLNGYTSVLDRITRQEVLPLVTPMLERFEHGLEDFMRENEVGDRELCTAYGLDFAPGLLWQAAAVVAQQHNVKRKIGFTGWRTPKEILGPLVEL